jgi:U3 small nucleolar RNA-associated protein 5
MSSIVTALSRPVPSNPPVICASQAPFIIDVEKTDDPPTSFPAMRNLIHTLISSRSDSVVTGQFLAADSDRYVNIFDPQRRKLVANLVTEKGVSSLSLYSRLDGCREESNKDLVSPEKQLLAVVTQDGAIELFVNPFFQAGESQGSKPATSLKLRASQMTKKADSLVKIVHPDSGAIVSVVAADFQGPELVVAWAEGGVNVVFERVRWQDANTGELSFKGTKEITRSKPASVLGSAAINGYRAAHESHVDESKAVLVSGRLVDDVDMHDVQGDSISISSGEESSGDEKEHQKGQDSGKKPPTRTSKNVAGKDVEMRDIGYSEVEQGEEAGEPSFGELLHATAPEAIDVEAEVDVVDSLVPSKGTAPASQIPSGVSLSTVLTQALRTNDHAMLESCFHIGDLVIVRTTIQRLDSSLAATLLQRLAERLASRPGRFGHLLVWVQWTCIAHGGAIAGKADILNRMSALFQVMDQRSSSLPSLLLLKGKLDMLDAQLKLRQSSARRDIENMDSEDDQDIIYVEGQDDVDDPEAEAAPQPSTTAPHTKSTRDTHGLLTEAEDDAIPNGIASISESENDENSDDEAVSDVDNLLDSEAEESTESSGAEESLEEHEADSDDESVGSMDDFIASSNDEDLSDVADGNLSTLPPSKKTKLSGQEKKKPAMRRK